MNNTPFITRNNDLFIMLIAGAGTMITTTYLLNLTVQAQFLMILTVGFLAGLFMSYLYQSLEWALFFVLGLQLVAISPLLLAMIFGKNVLLIDFIQVVMTTGRHGSFLLSSWIISIPAGYLLQKLIMGNYYRRTLF